MMLNENIFELKIKEIISDTLDFPFEDISDDADIMEDLGADSIAVLDLIAAIEDEFKISVSDADVIENRRVSDIVRYITEAV